jgi:hypothetical protein
MQLLLLLLLPLKPSLLLLEGLLLRWMLLENC